MIGKGRARIWAAAFGVAILGLPAATASAAEFWCYMGDVDADVFGLDKVGVAIYQADDYAWADVLEYYGGEILSINDLFCNRPVIGECGILDDSGRIIVESYAPERMVIRFPGRPYGIEADWPAVDMHDPVDLPSVELLRTEACDYGREDE